MEWSGIEHRLDGCDFVILQVHTTKKSAMRINERALASYSMSSATPVDRAGWLWKRGEVNREDVFATRRNSNWLCHRTHVKID